ncbi:MAG: magnesium transporter, partial [Roseovarius sp.]
MILYYAKDSDGLRQVPRLDDAPVLWIDMVTPSPQELEQMSRQFGLDLPSREDQEEIEQSSRLYLEEGVPVMTAILPSRKGSEPMQMGPVTFVLT